MYKLPLLLFILLTSLFVKAQQITQSDSLSILFIGNSFTHMNDMPSIFNKIAVSKDQILHVEKNTQAGASFRVHTTRPDLFLKIKDRKWDYVVLQGYSRELSHTKVHIDTATIPYITQIIDSIRFNNSCTNLLFYNTWGYKNGFVERDEINTYKKMQDSINSGYKYISEHFNIPIVPVGYVWELVRSQHPEMNLYVEDEQHPNRLGSYLSASTFYASIYNDTPEGAITSTISTENAEIIQKAAADIVLNNYKKFNLDFNTYLISNYRTKNVKYMAQCNSNFPNAKSIKWDFGDGKTTNEQDVLHEYHKPGKYIVRLIVEDECGIRQFKKKIVFEAPKKPKKPVKSEPKKKPTSKKKI